MVRAAAEVGKARAEGLQALSGVCTAKVRLMQTSWLRCRRSSSWYHTCQIRLVVHDRAAHLLMATKETLWTVENVDLPDAERAVMTSSLSASVELSEWGIE